jgi:hypothetical protein
MRRGSRDACLSTCIKRYLLNLLNNPSHLSYALKFITLKSPVLIALALECLFVGASRRNMEDA